MREWYWEDILISKYGIRYSFEIAANSSGAMEMTRIILETLLLYV